jgi:hypothetical protein
MGDEGGLHQLVVYVDDCVQVLDRGHIVICWLFILGWIGEGNGKVALMGVGRTSP